MKIKPEKIIAMYEKLGYPLLSEGDYNLNIFGIRSNEKESNKFNDIIGVLYKVNGDWKCNVFQATTDPGLYYRENPMNVKGTAILKEGYYSQAFRVGYHKGKYLALVQNTPLELYRDNNRDGKLDTDGKTYFEYAGINIHHASFNGVSEEVGKWSAGCQVLADIEDWGVFIDLVNTSSRLYGNLFSYALFSEVDL